MALTRLGTAAQRPPYEKGAEKQPEPAATEQVEAAKTLDDIPAGPTAEELIAALRTLL